jgi:hypothetical protein
MVVFEVLVRMSTVLLLFIHWKWSKMDHHSQIHLDVIKKKGEKKEKKRKKASVESFTLRGISASQFFRR